MVPPLPSAFSLGGCARGKCFWRRAQVPNSADGGGASRLDCCCSAAAAAWPPRSVSSLSLASLPAVRRSPDELARASCVDVALSIVDRLPVILARSIQSGVSGSDADMCGIGGGRGRCALPPFTEHAICREAELAWLLPLLWLLLPGAPAALPRAAVAAGPADLAAPLGATALPPCALFSSSRMRCRRSCGDMLAALSWKWELLPLDSTDPNLEAVMLNGQAAESEGS